METQWEMAQRLMVKGPSLCGEGEMTWSVDWEDIFHYVMVNLVLKLWSTFGRSCAESFMWLSGWWGEVTTDSGLSRGHCHQRARAKGLFFQEIHKGSAPTEGSLFSDLKLISAAASFFLKQLSEWTLQNWCKEQIPVNMELQLLIFLRTSWVLSS